MDKTHTRVLATHRRAKFEYHLSDQVEAGLVLTGSEVKSLRSDSSANLTDGWVEFRPDGAWLCDIWINPYEQANRFNHEPRRPRKLLLKQNEIDKLRKGSRERGVTVIPLKLYFKGSRVKVEIALARGKKLHDKRQSLKERDIKKQLRRVK